MTPSKSVLLMAAGLTGLAVSAACLARGVEPFQTWFYSFAWWSYLAFLNGAIARGGGDALLLSRPREFLFLAGISAPLWFVFELFNARLGNWAYLGVPRVAWLRWPGYVLAYATVAPAILQTAEALGVFARPVSLRGAAAPVLGERWPLRWVGGALKEPRLRLFWAFLGAASLLLPLLWPKVFFPLIWGGFFFLLDPWNARKGWPSLIAQWSRGDFSTTGRLLLSGLLCGMLWEFWNYWAGAKWVYSIPVLSSPKVFEMPLAGYLGFPPFALQAFAMVASARGIYKRLGGPGRFGFWIFLAAFCGVAAWVTDRFTVRSFQS